jgi:predicted  nucleic acid-binding Zn-ribbon protein
VSSYRTLLDTDDAYTNKLALNKAEQVSLTRKLQDLQDEEEAIKTKKKQGEMEMARLHKSLSDRDRALLTLGMDLQITKNKRGRDCESGQEGGGEDEYE